MNAFKILQVLGRTNEESVALAKRVLGMSDSKDNAVVEKYDNSRAAWAEIERIRSGIHRGSINCCEAMSSIVFLADRVIAESQICAVTRQAANHKI